MIYLYVPRRSAPPAVGADKRAPAAVAGEYLIPYCGWDVPALFTTLSGLFSNMS